MIEETLQSIAAYLGLLGLVSLRIFPVIAFAQPFTLVKIPMLVRLALTVSISVWLLNLTVPNPAIEEVYSNYFIWAIKELLVGISIALPLQLAFAAILTVGKTIDIQAGFGLATIADPTLKTQMPLIGTIFSYATGMLFFTTNGPSDLLAIWVYSVENIPIGESSLIVKNFPILANYIKHVFFISFGIAGGVILTIFLVDLVIAILSRTLPQMNALLLGFQVKTLVLLACLPFVFAYTGSLFLNLLNSALRSTQHIVLK